MDLTSSFLLLLTLPQPARDEVINLAAVLIQTSWFISCFFVGLTSSYIGNWQSSTHWSIAREATTAVRWGNIFVSSSWSTLTPSGVKWFVRTTHLQHFIIGFAAKHTPTDTRYTNYERICIVNAETRTPSNFLPTVGF